MTETPASGSEAVAAYHRGVASHRERRLTDAMRSYEKALQLSPPREPNAGERAMILRHAPRLFTCPDEPLPLKDAAAILHPHLPLIGYHLFWEDDIDFPANSDPCDHEVAWVQFDESGERVNQIYTYYHGFVLPAPEALSGSVRYGERPRIDVQWGKHGLLPCGWQGISELLVKDMQRTHRRLHTLGCRNADHPLARSWPHRFEGDWEAFIDFSLEVDPRVFLRRNEMMMVGCFANAIIDCFFLRYNFWPKYSWPDRESTGGGVI